MARPRRGLWRLSRLPSHQATGRLEMNCLIASYAKAGRPTEARSRELEFPLRSKDPNPIGTPRRKPGEHVKVTDAVWMMSQAEYHFRRMKQLGLQPDARSFASDLAIAKGVAASSSSQLKYAENPPWLSRLHNARKSSVNSWEASQHGGNMNSGVIEAWEHIGNRRLGRTILKYVPCEMSRKCRELWHAWIVPSNHLPHIRYQMLRWLKFYVRAEKRDILGEPLDPRDAGWLAILALWQLHRARLSARIVRVSCHSLPDKAAILCDGCIICQGARFSPGLHAV